MSQINWLDMFPHYIVYEYNNWFNLRFWDKQYIRGGRMLIFIGIYGIRLLVRRSVVENK